VIDVLTKEVNDDEFTKVGTIDIINNRVVFEISDPGILELMQQTPPEIVKRGAQQHLDFIKSRFAFSSTILLMESV